jgi:site-specific DNA recombinase
MNLLYRDPPVARYGLKAFLERYGKSHRSLASPDGAPARGAIRALVEKIVVQPGNGRGGKHREIRLHGALFSMLAFAERAAGGSVGNGDSPVPFGPGLL